MQRAQRLRSNADFRRVRAARRSWAHPLLVLYVASNELEQSRMGVSVSRRVGQAVVRNKVRRRLREAVRARWSEVAGGKDLLFVARGPCVAADWPALRGAVDQLLHRARLLPSAARLDTGKAEPLGFLPKPHPPGQNR